MLAERRQRRRDGRGWEWAYNVANVEYTEFERLGVPDEAAAGSALSRFPANTNVLYVGLQARRPGCPVSHALSESCEGCAPCLCYRIADSAPCADCMKC